MKISGISVVIPNYNGINLLPEILPFLFRALEKAGLPYEVIISDDNSSDGSPGWIRQHYPTIHLIESDKNGGFSITINKGLFKAVHSHVLLLNSDVKLEEDYFLSQFKYFDLPDTFGVMGRIIGWKDDVIQDGAKYPALHGIKIKTSGNYIAERPSPDDKLFSFYLSGANAFVDREKLLLLNGFDEIYSPFYVEDVDLSLRAWRLGWKCYYDHFSVCRHNTSVTIKSKAGKKHIEAIYYRNKMLLHSIHLTGWPLRLFYLQLIPETLLRLLTLRFHYLKSLAMFFRSGALVKHSRQSLQLLSQKCDRPLLSVYAVISRIRQSVAAVFIKRF